jgi:uncharacterized phage protein gp47/JayE
MGPNALFYSLGAGLTLLLIVNIVHYALRRNRVIRHSQSASPVSITAGVTAHLYRQAAGLNDEMLSDEAQQRKIDADAIIERYIKEKESGAVDQATTSPVSPVSFGRKITD